VELTTNRLYPDPSLISEALLISYSGIKEMLLPKYA
jgi:hypothetical protein